MIWEQRSGGPLRSRMVDVLRNNRINIAKFGRCAYARRPFCVMLIGFDETRTDTGGKAVIKIEQTEIFVPLIYNLLTFDPFGGTI